MIYRLAVKEDLNRMTAMVNQAKAAFQARGIDQWQKGEPNETDLAASIEEGRIRVLEEEGRVAAMITLQEGADPSYGQIDGAWLNDRPYVGFHRVCVEEALRGRGLAARLFSLSEDYVRSLGYENIRIDTHPDNLPMQRALAKSGYRLCGSIHLAGGAEDGALRLAFQKVLVPAR